MKVGKLRTGCGSRSALTATYNSLAPISMPAASGCSIGSVSHLLLPFLAICSSDHAGRMPGARTLSKLPIEIVAETDERHHTSGTQPQTHALGRALNRAPMSARAVAVIRPAATIIARLAFLYILSGRGRQLHASAYLSANRRVTPRSFGGSFR